MILFTWAFPALVFLAWHFRKSDFGKGCWRMIRVPQILYLTPLPGMRSRLLFLA